jgi:hypothetical protein
LRDLKKLRNLFATSKEVFVLVSIVWFSQHISAKQKNQFSNPFSPFYPCPVFLKVLPIAVCNLKNNVISLTGYRQMGPNLTILHFVNGGIMVEQGP